MQDCREPDVRQAINAFSRCGAQWSSVQGTSQVAGTAEGGTPDRSSTPAAAFPRPGPGARADLNARTQPQRVFDTASAVKS